MTIHLNSYTNIPGVWEKEEKMIQEKWFIGVDFLMLFDKWYIKVSYSFMRLSKWTFILPMTVCHKQWEETISLQKCIKREIWKLYFPPDNSNSTPMLLIFSSPFLCLFPFTLCPVLEFAQTPLDCRVMWILPSFYFWRLSLLSFWGVIPITFVKAGFCFYCRIQFPSLDWCPMSEIYLLDVCQICKSLNTQKGREADKLFVPYT